MSMHWIAFGDFNNALNPKDKNGGLSIPFSYIIGFKIAFYNVVLMNVLYRTANIHGGKDAWRVIWIKSW